jgi:hypothetical protein
MGLDATATTQMFCFDTVARHIVGRPCETVLKQATEAAPIPLDLAQIVSLKFTFHVTASNQTFDQREKQPTVLQINSIVVVHGRQHSLPSGIQNTIDQGPSTPNKEATLKLLKESSSTAMERLSTKVSKDVSYFSIFLILVYNKINKFDTYLYLSYILGWQKTHIFNTRRRHHRVLVTIFKFKYTNF